MTVVVLTLCPPGLRGLLTRWLLEISAGVFIGDPSARVRDALWEEIKQHVGVGRALLAYTTDNEQGFTFRTHDHAWRPVELEGLILIQRPSDKTTATPSAPATRGWSKASQRHHFRNR